MAQQTYSAIPQQAPPYAQVAQPPYPTTTHPTMPVQMVAAQPPAPQVVNQTQVVLSQPGGGGGGGGKDSKKRDWDTTLCGCCEDCAICWLVMLFGPCYMCFLAHKMKEHCCMSIWVCPQTIALMSLRLKLRSANNIKGSILDDYCVSNCACCTLCAICQLARQIYILKRNNNYIV